MEEKRKAGLCFRCDAKWSRDHQCPQRELQVLTVVNGYEMEILDKQGPIMLEPIDEYQDNLDTEYTSLAALSLNFFLGFNTLTTTKIRVRTGASDVVTLIDNGASDNFISPDTIAHLRLPIEAAPNIQIILGTGISASSLGVTNNVFFAVSPSASLPKTSSF